MSFSITLRLDVGLSYHIMPSFCAGYVSEHAKKSGVEQCVFLVAVCLLLRRRCWTSASTAPTSTYAPSRSSAGENTASSHEFRSQKFKLRVSIRDFKIYNHVVLLGKSSISPRHPQGLAGDMKHEMLETLTFIMWAAL